MIELLEQYYNWAWTEDGLWTCYKLWGLLICCLIPVVAYNCGRGQAIDDSNASIVCIFIMIFAPIPFWFLWPLAVCALLPLAMLFGIFYLLAPRPQDLSLTPEERRLLGDDYMPQDS